MRISHSKKFVYIAIPKTGSSTVRRLLDPYSEIKSTQSGGRPGQFDHHITAASLKKIFEKKANKIIRRNSWKWSDYFKFTIVRHPALRLRSSYHYQIKIGSQPPDDNLLKNDMGFYNRCRKLFETGHSLDEAIISGDMNYRPMHNWTHDSDGNLLVDYVCKLENIDAGLPIIWSSIGLDKKDLDQIPVTNRSVETNQDQHPSAYFTGEAYALIKQNYAKDFRETLENPAPPRDNGPVITGLD
jgi:hypothetical protein